MKRISLFSLVLSISFAALSCAKKPEAATPAAAQKAPVVVAKDAKETKKSPSVAVTKGGISVIELAACRSIENKAPVGSAEKFASDVGRIYVFTKVGLDASKEGSIKHVWKFNKKEITTIKLPVKGPQWRTYSSKKIDASLKGDWEVDVVTDADEVLKSVSFKIE
jgi:hypothetical protein